MQHHESPSKESVDQKVALVMDVKIVRSRHRAKTVSAREVDGYLLVQAPAGMSDADLQPIVDKLKHTPESEEDED